MMLTGGIKLLRIDIYGVPAKTSGEGGSQVFTKSREGESRQRTEVAG